MKLLYRSNKNTYSFSLAAAGFMALAASASATFYEIDAYNGKTVTTETGYFYDSGAWNHPYKNNENFCTTFCAPAGKQLKFSFVNFAVNGPGDKLSVYDGRNANARLIGIYSGTTAPRTIQSTSGCLHFVFKSNSTSTNNGWCAQICSVSTPKLASLGDCIFNDANKNGIQDSLDYPAAGAKVELCNGQGQPISGVAAQITKSNGAYLFSNLAPGSYIVKVTPPAGFGFSRQAVGTDRNIDSDVNATSGRSNVINLTSGQARRDIDAGICVNVPATCRSYSTNFSQYSEGAIIDTEYVFGGAGNTNSNLPAGAGFCVIATGGTNQAIVYNTNPPIGNDGDLESNTGGALVVQEAGNNGIPDDVVGGKLKFKFESQLISWSGLVLDQDNAASELVFENSTTGQIAVVRLSDLFAASTFADGAFQNTGELNVARINSILASAGRPLTLPLQSFDCVTYNMSNISTINGAAKPASGGGIDSMTFTPDCSAPLASIGGCMFNDDNCDGKKDTGEAGINDLVIELLDSQMRSIDSNASVEGVQPTTTRTQNGGLYTFSNVLGGTYFVQFSKPTRSTYTMQGTVAGSTLDSDVDANGKTAAITIAAGESNQTICAGVILFTPNTIADWKTLNPLGGQNALSANPDGDAFSNLVEYALGYDPSSGLKVGTKGQRNRGLELVLNPQTRVLDASFTRPQGITDVTYMLQFSLNAQPFAMVTISPVVVNNNDGTEKVTFPNIESLGNNGVVRLKLTATDAGSTVENFSPLNGWNTRTVRPLCESYSYPYLKPCLFTATVSANAISGNTIDFSQSLGGKSLQNVMSGNGKFYMEVTSGDNIGHRFDIASVSANGVTIAQDDNIYTGSVYNTQLNVPVSLSGDSIVIREHFTLSEVFPPSAYVAGNDPATPANAARLLFFNVTTQLIEETFLYTNGGNPIWVKVGDATFVNQGANVLPTALGVFTHNYSPTPGNRNDPAFNFQTLQFGEVRTHAVAVPLGLQRTFIASPHPAEQSPNQRSLTASNGFIAAGSIVAADQYHIWNDDRPAAVIPNPGYTVSTFFDSGAAKFWIRGSDIATPQQDLKVFRGDRSAMYNNPTTLERPNYIIPSPFQN